MGIAHDQPLQFREEPQTRDLTTRSLCIRSATIDEATRSIEATMATETPVMVMDWRTYETIDEVLVMRGGKMPAQLPLLESHNRYTLDAVLGSVRELRIDNDKAVGRLYFAADDERIDKVWNKVKQRHITDVSIGYRVLSYVDIPAGQTQEVNGRSYTAGNRRLRIATEWEGKELSVVAIGADHNSKTRQATDGPPTSTEALQVNDQLRAFLESLGLRKDATLAEAWTFYHARQGAERARADELLGASVPPAATPPATPEGQRSAPVVPGNNPQTPGPTADEIRRAERERCDRIRQLGDEEGDRTIVERAISEDWTVQRTAEAILQGRRDRRGSGSGAGVPPGAPAGHVRESERERSAEVLGAALMVRCGIALDNPAFAHVHTRQALHANRATRFLARDVNDEIRQRIMDTAHRYRERSMIDIARECLRIDGHEVPESRSDVIDLAMRSAVTGGSLANVYTTAFSAQLLATYQELGDSTMGWCREADVPNFQSNERARLTKGGGLTKHARGGSADHMPRSDEAESYKIGRYTGQYAVDEMDWIDDRLNWITDQPTEMAYAAARLRPDLVYAIFFANANLADGGALFNNTAVTTAGGHANTDTSAGLADGTLRAAIAAMNTQTENGVNLGLQPSHLIVPSALRFTAAQLIRSAEIRNVGDGTSGDNAQFGTYNPLSQEGLRLVSDARLDNGVTDPNTGTTYSGDANDWFLTDARFPAIEVGHLQGTGRRPQVSSWVKKGEDGQWIMGFAVKHDIGAKAIRFASILRRQG